MSQESVESIGGTNVETQLPPRKLFSGVNLAAGFLITSVVVLLLLLPAVRFPRSAAKKAGCMNLLRQIGAALQAYQNQWNALPPAYTVDEAGHRLHSWRTLILPYLDQQGLYDSIDLSKPWDDPVNAPARMTRLEIFECPELPQGSQKTVYLAAVGADYCLQGGVPRKISDITDGTRNSVMIIEANPDYAVEWMEPEDGGEKSLLAMTPEKKTNHAGGCCLVLADGTVRFMPSTVPDHTRQSLLNIHGHDSICDDF